MQRIEQMAREICLLDLKAKGIEEPRANELADRFWPVLANEIREGLLDGTWPFTAAEIDSLAREYQQILAS
ncbi:hypothetical protein G3A50_00655 [Ancylobacter pratisalsi]|uniref:Uncharacterized protein n=2 Tax=Ancylobacter pratisalsi TaxID=1745854 RepID=A0A6P1YGG7_9HYPH|nr:hypothetical protein G3A50_00655 [Ancylobacter pratisalsi]